MTFENAQESRDWFSDRADLLDSVLFSKLRTRESLTS